MEFYHKPARNYHLARVNTALPLIAKSVLDKSLSSDYYETYPKLNSYQSET